MWSGQQRCVAPARGAWPWMRRRFEPTPSISAPIAISRRQRSCTCGSQAALWIVVRPSASAAAMSAFSVAVTDASSRWNSVPWRPLGARKRYVRSAVDLGAQAGEREQVRVDAPAADDVAARRRHVGAAEAREQRPGEQDGRADALRERLVERRRVARRRRTRAPRCAPSTRPRRRARRAARAWSRRRGCAACCGARRARP